MRRQQFFQDHFNNSTTKLYTYLSNIFITLQQVNIVEFTIRVYKMITRVKVSLFLKSEFNNAILFVYHYLILIILCILKFTSNLQNACVKNFF